MSKKLYSKINNEVATHDTMYHIKDNIRDYLAKNNMTMNELAEKADISEHTLHSIIYKDIEDLKLHTAIALAGTMGIGIDELANVNTMQRALSLIRICRELPPHIIDLIERYILWQKEQYDLQDDKRKKIIEVMNLDYIDFRLRATNYFEKVDISEFDDDVKSIVFRGMRMPCSDYYQFYQEDDILLLSAIRQPINKERCVVSYHDRVFVVKKEGDGYRGTRDRNVFIPVNDIDHYFGYVVAVKHKK